MGARWIQFFLIVTATHAALLPRTCWPNNNPKPPTNPCAQALVLPASAQLTHGLTAYLEELLTLNIVSAENLNQMLVALQNGTLVNPVDFQSNLISPVHQIHFESIADFIKDSRIDKTVLQNWLQKRISNTIVQRQARGVVQNKTRETFDTPLFNRLPKGKFLLIAEAKAYQVELTYPFEMMSTPVTQKHWVDLMKKNPSHFLNQPNNPVEEVTWYSAIVFANKLSEKMGFTPAYDLSEAVFEPKTSAEAGTLRLRSGRVKPNSPDGSIYNTEGYRLPTTTERQWVVSNLGEHTNKPGYIDYEGPLAFDLKKNQLLEYGWFQKNSNGQTKPIATNAAFPHVNGEVFFDMIGNVSEWNHDWHDFYFSGGQNPQGPASGNQKEIFRGSWSHWLIAPNDFPNIGCRDHISPDIRTDWLGFRLVRTLH